MALPLPKSGILEVKPYISGDAHVEKARYLASNENPLGCSPKAREAYLNIAAELHRYPDGGVADLRAALGAEEGEVEINISANLASSSVLPMLDTHVKAAPQSAYIGTERVPQRRLDGLAASYLKPDSILLIKIDTQGHDAAVIRGGTATISAAAALQLELPASLLYEGAASFSELVQEARSLGFALLGTFPVHERPRPLIPVEFDGLFARAR